jgi:hypothetical protein
MAILLAALDVCALTVGGLRLNAAPGSLTARSTGVRACVSSEVLGRDAFTQPGRADGPLHGAAPIVFVHGTFHGGWCWAEHWMGYFAQQGCAAHRRPFPISADGGAVLL